MMWSRCGILKMTSFRWVNVCICCGFLACLNLLLGNLRAGRMSAQDVGIYSRRRPRVLGFNMCHWYCSLWTVDPSWSLVFGIRQVRLSDRA